MREEMDRRMSETLDRLKKEKKDALKGLLDQCTEKQVSFFNQMYGSFETIPEEKIDWAIQQCERTIKGNEQG